MVNNMNKVTFAQANTKTTEQQLLLLVITPSKREKSQRFCVLSV